MKKENILSCRKLKGLSLFFICFLTFGSFGSFLFENLSIVNEIRQITASWSPNISDLGKLKYVINNDLEFEQDVFAGIEELCMPFENNYLTELESGVFEVNGLGGLVVKSCLVGVVTKIENVEGKKNVYISHGKSLISVYEGLDSVGVKKGDNVQKNSPIGVSVDSVIKFKMLYKNNILGGLTIKDGELSFV